MQWNDHSRQAGNHALFSPSNYHWLDNAEEYLYAKIDSIKAKERGTRLHDLAEKLIKEGVRLADEPKTLNMYVNDAIGFHMDTEIVLYYSKWFYGKADAISFRQRTLRIHDLKTGESGDMKQLLIYAALFCLEYDTNPKDIQIILRIYKENSVEELFATLADIQPIIDQITSWTRILQEEEVNDYRTD